MPIRKRDPISGDYYTEYPENSNKDSSTINYGAGRKGAHFPMKKKNAPGAGETFGAWQKRMWGKASPKRQEVRMAAYRRLQKDDGNRGEIVGGGRPSGGGGGRPPGGGKGAIGQGYAGGVRYNPDPSRNIIGSGGMYRPAFPSASRAASQAASQAEWVQFGLGIATANKLGAKRGKLEDRKYRPEVHGPKKRPTPKGGGGGGYRQH